jgi:hypothetical protein
MAELPFDRVALEDGSSRILSVSEFLELPLDERVRLVLSRKLRFLNGAEEVDLKVGLKRLMTLTRVVE